MKKINSFAKCGKIQRTVAKVYRDALLKSQAKEVAISRNERIRKTVKLLIKNGKFSSENFWKLRKSLSKRAEVCTSIITANGNEVFGDDCVRNAYRNEFQQRLEMEEGSSDMKEYQKKTKLVTDMLMFKLTEAKEENFRWEELSKVLKTLKRGKAVGLDEIPGEVLADCSKEVENAMLSAMNDIKKKHEIPKQWERVSITTIYKGKGSQKELVNHRGIFLTPVLSKVFERLICLRIEPFMERMSKYQAEVSWTSCSFYEV